MLRTKHAVTMLLPSFRYEGLLNASDDLECSCTCSNTQSIT